VAVYSRWVLRNIQQVLIPEFEKQHCPFPCSNRSSGGRGVPHWVHVEFPEQARTEEGLLGPLNTYIMSSRDCKGPLLGCLWFVAGWAWLVVFIFLQILPKTLSVCVQQHGLYPNHTFSPSLLRVQKARRLLIGRSLRWFKKN